MALLAASDLAVDPVDETADCVLVRCTREVAHVDGDEERTSLDACRLDLRETPDLGKEVSYLTWSEMLPSEINDLDFSCSAACLWYHGDLKGVGGIGHKHYSIHKKH